MPQNILETIDRLPPRAKLLLESAIQLADNELKLQVVDTSVVLLIIIRLGDGNASAKWLRSTGLTEDTILRFINQEFTQREKGKPRQTARGAQCQTQNIPVFTTAITRMINRLVDGFARNGRATDAVYVCNVAIAYSDSRTVQLIFNSVGLDMADVRSTLGTPPTLDLGRLHLRRS